MIPTSTPRDALLGALLWCDRAVEDLRQSWQSGAGVQPASRELAEALREVLQAAELLDPDSSEHMVATGYGLPEWLCADEQHGAFGALDLLMTKERGDVVFGCTSGSGRQVFDEADLEQFYSAVDRLDLVRCRRLLPQRLGAPGLSFSSLARSLLGAAPGALAAATAETTPGSLREHLARAWGNPGLGNPIERELACRLLRVDVPVLYNNLGVVLGLYLEFSDSSDGRCRAIADESNHARVDKGFRNGIQTGHVAAVRLLRAIGAPRDRVLAATLLRYRLPGLLPGSRPVDGLSVGLPVALHVIAHVLDLEPLACASTGPVAVDGQLEIIPESVARAKAAAVEADGFRSGLAASSAGGAQAYGLVELTGETLQDACRQLWGRAWQEAVRETADSQLRAVGCKVEFGIPSDERALADHNGVVIGVRTPQHDMVIDYLNQYPADPVVVGGPPCVGKSWTVRTVLTELVQQGWQTIVIRFQDNQLPRLEEAATLVQRALTMRSVSLSPASAQRTLVVLEDLHAVPDATDLRSVLLSIAKECACSVIAVASATSGNQATWDQRGLNVILMPSDLASVVKLVEALVAQYPHRFGNAVGREGAIATASASDRWWLVRLLDFVSHSPGADTKADLLTAAFVKDRTAGLEDGHWPTAGTLAAYSALGLPAPRADLPGLSDEQMIRLGAYQVAGGWTLPSPAARNVILHPINANYTRALHESLSRPLGRLLDAKNVTAVLRLLQSAASVCDGDLHKGLIEDFAPTLVGTLQQHADRLELAVAVSLFRVGLSDAQLAALVRQLAVRLLTRGWPEISADRVITCLRALRTNDHVLDQLSDEEINPDDMWETLLSRLDQVLTSLLRQAPPQQALGLMQELDRLRRPELTSSAMERVCIDGLTNVRAESGDDRFTAVKLARLARRISSRSVRTANRRTLVEELVDSQGWRRLAGARLLPGDAADYLAHLTMLDLTDQSTDKPSLREIEDQLLVRIPRTHLSTFAQALKQLRDHAPAEFATVRRTDLASVVGTAILLASPLAVSELLTVLGQLHPQLACSLLYERDGRPRAQLLESLASRVERGGDLRTAGYLIETCANIDQEFGAGDNGFGQMLVVRLRPLLTTMISGQRPLVILNVVRALASARCEVEELDELREAFISIVVNGLNGSAASAHEAEIAMILAADEVLDGSFLAELRGLMQSDTIPRSVLLHKMKIGDSPSALMHYHVLALAVDPTLCASYQGRKPTATVLVRRLRDRRTPSILQAIQAIGRTLGYAGESAATQDYLSKLEPSPSAWAIRLGRVRDVRDLGSCIDLLRKLAPDLCKSALERFGRHEAHGDVESSALRFAELALSGATQPEDGIALLASVRSVHPVLATNAVDRVSRSSRLWAVRSRAVIELDNPARLGQALTQIASLGLPINRHLRQELERQSVEIAAHMRSPQTIGILLGGLLAVDQNIGRRFVARLNHDGVIARVSRKRRGDGPGLASLVAALAYAGRSDLTLRITEALTDGAPRSIKVSDAARLLRAMHAASPDAARSVAEQLRREVLETALDRRIVADPNKHLLSIGWLARQIRLTGCPVHETGWLPDNTLEHPAPRLWGEIWLAPCTARRAILDRLLVDAAASCDQAPPWTSALVLISAAELGMTADILRLRADWTRALEAGIDWFVELLLAGKTDAALCNYLANHKELLIQHTASITQTRNIFSDQVTHLVAGIRDESTPATPAEQTEEAKLDRA